MSKRISYALFACLFFFAVTPTQAVTVLYDWGFNIDGNISDASTGMPGIGTLDSSGLGTLNFDITGAGDHSFVAFFDFEIDQATNTFFNEYGTATGTAAAGQSWEIDEPGWVFGDIYDNMQAGALDNSNAVDATFPDDVSFALGWDFTLGANDFATITLNLEDILPTLLPDFYLTHADVDSPDTIFFWSELDIVSVPEPASLALLLIGLFGLLVIRKSNT